MLTSLAGREGPRSKRGSIRILVVDDSDDLRGLISAWLEDEGYAVVTAGSGREALDAAAVYYPDIVLLDLVIPPPDGFEVCAALRNHLPPQIILMTGLSDPDHVRRALDLGVVALLRKPLTREAVVDASDDCCGTMRAGSPVEAAVALRDAPQGLTPAGSWPLAAGSFQLPAPSSQLPAPSSQIQFPVPSSRFPSSRLPAV